MKKILQGIALFLICSVKMFALNISSSSFDRRIDGAESAYKDFKIINGTTTTQRYRVGISSAVKSGQIDISKYFTVRPKIVTVPPYSERNVRVYAHTTDKLPKGEYSFIMNINPIIIPALRKKEAEKGKVLASVGMPINVDLNMKGYTGEITPEMVKENIKFENVKIVKELDSKTKKYDYFLTGRVKSSLYAAKKIIFYYLDGIGNTVVGSIYFGRVTPNADQKFKIPVKKPFSKLGISYENDEEKRVRFNIIEINKQIAINSRGDNTNKNNK